MSPGAERVSATGRPLPRAHPVADGLAAILSVAVLLAAVAVLADLALRSVLRLEIRWDAVMYHLPFAAIRGGIETTYVLSDRMAPLFTGFPPLPHLVEGLLWRLSGSVNATGAVNMLAFVTLLAYGHVVLRAAFWLVALIALTAPLVLIHASTNYVDLFSNALLAIGIGSCLSLWLFPERASRAILFGGLAGIAGATWSKYQLAPVAGVVFVLLAVVAWRVLPALDLSRREFGAVIVFGAIVAAFPYLKNLGLYGNPFWPVRVPLLGDLFPYTWDAGATTAGQRPRALAGAPQVEVFVRSLFEVDNPTSYPSRARWNIDQGNAHAGFRMGGFWFIGVIVYLGMLAVLLARLAGRRGAVALVAFAALLAFTAFLPQSHELRYHLWIPLTWALGVAMLIPRLWQVSVRATAGLLAVVLVLFTSMAIENATHLVIESRSWREAASAWHATTYWPQMESGRVYCAVGVEPIGILLTGPTMREFIIVDRTERELCPSDSTILTWEGVEP